VCGGLLDFSLWPPHCHTCSRAPKTAVAGRHATRVNTVYTKARFCETGVGASLLVLGWVRGGIPRARILAPRTRGGWGGVSRCWEATCTNVTTYITSCTYTTNTMGSHDGSHSIRTQHHQLVPSHTSVGAHVLHPLDRPSGRAQPIAATTATLWGHCAQRRAPHPYRRDGGVHRAMRDHTCLCMYTHTSASRCNFQVATDSRCAIYIWL
jgi:hypothetical protein